MHVLNRRDYFIKIAVCLLYTYYTSRITAATKIAVCLLNTYYTGGITVATVLGCNGKTRIHTMYSKNGPYKHLGRRKKCPPCVFRFRKIGLSVSPLEQTPGSGNSRSAILYDSRKTLQKYVFHFFFENS
jgi:hypothetical protein